MEGEEPDDPMGRKLTADDLARMKPPMETRELSQNPPPAPLRCTIDIPSPLPFPLSPKIRMRILTRIVRVEGSACSPICTSHCWTPYSKRFRT